MVPEGESVSRRHAIIDCQSSSECYVAVVGAAMEYSS